MRLSRPWSLVLALAAVVPLVSPAASASASDPVYRAFPASSWWNVPLPADAPVHADSAGMISFLKSTNVEEGCPLLAGAGTNRWGTPVYWAQDGDPTYDVETIQYAVPPEFASLRIPAGAKPADNGDAEMTVFDEGRGYVAWLHDAVYDAVADRWTVEGGSIAYLGSNGLHGTLTASDEPRNTGSHRGLNGAVVAARYDEMSAGAIDHVLRIGVAQAAPTAVFPMIGSDGDSSDPLAPPQGTRIRIKPGVDLSSYGLHPEAHAIATALQRYGAVVGDTTGAPVELKLEDTVSAGRGQLWDVGVYGLCTIPLDVYEVIEHGYVAPTDSTGTVTAGPTEEAVSAPIVSVSDVAYAKKGRHLDVAVSLQGPSGAVAGARVALEVFRGTTSVSKATVETDAAGTAHVRVSHAKAGCYTTSVSAVEADGYVWDGLVPDEVWCT